MALTHPALITEANQLCADKKYCEYFYLRGCHWLDFNRFLEKSNELITKEIDITGCSIHGASGARHAFAKHRKVKKFAIDWCCNFHWIHFIKKLKSLETLQIENFNRIHCAKCQMRLVQARNANRDICLTELVKALHQSRTFKVLVIGGIPSEEDISHLRSLKKLKLIYHIDDCLPQALNSLHSCSILWAVQLENASQIKDDHLYELLWANTNLQCLTLVCCDNVSNNFVFRAAELLEKRNEASPLSSRLVMKLCDCDGISVDIGEKEQYAKAESAISLIIYRDSSPPPEYLREDLIIPYPRPNQDLSIYMLYKIFSSLRHSTTRYAFRCVCEDFEVAAMDEYIHEIKVAALHSETAISNNNWHLINIDDQRAERVVLEDQELSIESLLTRFPSANEYNLLRCSISISSNVYEEPPANKNATKFVLSREYPSMKFLRPIVRLLPNLCEIDLPESNVTDADMRILCELNRLTYLNLAWNDKITGKYITEMPRLRELILDDCLSLKSLYLLDILQYLPLQRLGISGCPEVFEPFTLNHQMGLFTLNKLKSFRLTMDENHKGFIAINNAPTLQNIKLVIGCAKDFIDSLNLYDLKYKLRESMIEKIEKEQLPRTKWPHKFIEADDDYTCVHVTPFYENFQKLDILSDKLVSLKLCHIFTDCKWFLQVLEKCRNLIEIECFVPYDVLYDVKSAAKIVQTRSDPIRPVTLIVHHIHRRCNLFTLPFEELGIYANYIQIKWIDNKKEIKMQF